MMMRERSREGGKGEGGVGENKGEVEKIGEYEGEVCKESVADDVNASAEGLHKNVRSWSDEMINLMPCKMYFDNMHKIFTNWLNLSFPDSMSTCYS